MEGVFSPKCQSDRHMFKYILQSAGNIEWMAIGPLLLFVIVFVTSSWLILRQSKAYVDKMSHLPLDDNHQQNPEI